MADRYTWTLDTPHPNVEVEAIRIAILQAIKDLRTAADGVDDTYWLSDLLFSLLDSALSDLAAATADRQQLRTDLDALTARVAALETLPPPDPEVLP